jgi:hypothetical protein
MFCQETCHLSVNCLTFVLGDKRFALELTHRDTGILMGPEWLMKEGRVFVQMIGVYDHYTVAGGIPQGSKSVKSRIVVKATTEALITKLKYDEDLLSWDYSYADPSNPQSNFGGSTSGYSYLGYSARIDVRPKGFCTLSLMEAGLSGRGRTVGLLDVRNKQAIALDSGGKLKIRRRKAELAMLPGLQSLREFLDNRESKQVVIYHRD